MPGDVDSQTVDLIAVYRLDRRDTKGVTLVQGSQDLQRAYRIGLDVNLTLPLKEVFPAGLPPHFTVVGTFNARGQRRPWSLVRARSESSLQFALTMLPVTKKIVVFIGGSRVMFNSWDIFTPGWHKIHASITNNTVHVAVDCVDIDLQWLSLSCDRYNLSRDTCEEIVMKIHNPAFIMITETHLHDKISDSMINIPGYVLYRLDRNDRKGGGVLIYTAIELNNTKISAKVNSSYHDSRVEALWLDVQIRKLKFLLVCVYRPPSYSLSESNKVLFDNIGNASLKNTVVIVGDFNMPNIVYMAAERC
ncbi:hypothetical protein HF086_012015 [Spodoptera exigua]|uniref:Thrombospondin-like N-terminal domain-containing protein n=1 Tax=Spodoptera exigua TaxID=7107 RepID=A0A922MJW8_SPOEX|nr:hypothetical protein HF086_012015 [Spodoptera exigua]